MNFTETALFAPLPTSGGEGEFLFLEEEEKRHLQVLRLSKGDRFQLLDGVGGETTAELLDPKKRNGATGRQCDSPPSPTFPLHCCFALEKRRLRGAIRTRLTAPSSKIPTSLERLLATEQKEWLDRLTAAQVAQQGACCPEAVSTILDDRDLRAGRTLQLARSDSRGEIDRAVGDERHAGR